jgi:hypothetical protein
MLAPSFEQFFAFGSSFSLLPLLSCVFWIPKMTTKIENDNKTFETTALSHIY